MAWQIAPLFLRAAGQDLRLTGLPRIAAKIAYPVGTLLDNGTGRFSENCCKTSSLHQDDPPKTLSGTLRANEGAQETTT